MFRGISLANKCLLLFGAAAVLIIMAALGVPWVRMYFLADEQELEVSRQMVRVFQSSLEGSPLEHQPGAPLGTPRDTHQMPIDGGHIALLHAEQAAEARAKDAFVGEAWERLNANARKTEFTATAGSGANRQSQYAMALRSAAGTLEGIIILERRAPTSLRPVLINSAFLAAAGTVALALALLVFYLITNKLILSPVRDLRETAEEVRSGNLETRSDIHTGDEFEELADAFNSMLAALQDGQTQLRAINTALDRRVGDLESLNLALNESNRVKGEFLANVSHELRTPLNSILGFADLLIETVEREMAAGDDSSRILKRKRYLENIVSAGRTLLDHINGLLEMAKVEAGKVEIACDPVDLREMAEVLAAMMRPVADKRGVEIRLDVADGVPTIETDSKKLQQIVFNLLSNAVKFTGDTVERLAQERAEAGIVDEVVGSPDHTADSAEDNGEAPPASAGAAKQRPLVILRVESFMARAGGGETAQDKVRISVLDTGPGIASENQQIIFEKFTQLDRGYHRKHAGTGLGLAICKELTTLLQGEIQVQSELGRGSMFSVILPVKLDQMRIAESKAEAKFRVSLAGKPAKV